MASTILTLSSCRPPTFNGSLEDGPLLGSSKANTSMTNPITSPFGGKLIWIGNATCIIEFENIRFMTDPNFLHAGDHVHLAPGVTAQRVKDPAFDYESCPAVDFVLLSHLHADHFDDLIAEKIRKNIPIISTPHACTNLGENGHASLHPLESWEKIHVTKDGTELTITSMPGNHTPSGADVPPDIVMPPVMGSMISFKRGNAVYNMYISGDTLYYDELKGIHQKYPHIQLALVHLGGTTLPVIRVMVTMDAVQGMKLLMALQPDKAIPIHIDDYDVFLSPLSDFQDEVKKAEWEDRIIYLKRGEQLIF